MTKLNQSFAEFWVTIFTDKGAWKRATREEKIKIIKWGSILTGGVFFVEGFKLALWIFACIGVYHTFFT